VSPGAMASDALRDELMAVDGVADAEVDESGATAGVKVRLTAEADADRVGEEVQRILSTHGLRSRLERAGTVPSGPPPPPGAPGRVVALPEKEPRRAEPEDEDGDAEVPAAPEPVPVVTGAILDGVSVEESRESVLITVRAADGRRVTRRARWSGGGLDEAVVAGIAELFGMSTPPMLVAAETVELDDTPVVVAVLERVDGRRIAGAAVVEAGRPFALAQAVWTALEADR